MRFNLVFLSLMIIMMTGVSHAETLRGRVIKIDRTSSGVSLGIETVDPLTQDSEKILLTLADLPRDIQLNSRITVEATRRDADINQGARYTATVIRFNSGDDKGIDRTGVRSRMKQSQGNSSSNRGSQRGRH